MAKTGHIGALNTSGYYSGTSGLLLPVPNKEFYPEVFKEKSRLHYYSSLFNSIEINSSFYKVPMARTITKWAADTPADFKFTFKLWREITHHKELAFDPDKVIDFLYRISMVADKKGCLLVQFPRSIKPFHIRQVEQLLNHIRKADPNKVWRVAIEFRHESWYITDTYKLLEQLGMGLVIHDKLNKGSAYMDLKTDFVYVRFHGPKGDYAGSYEDSFLYEYAAYLKEWLADGKQVYIYFNNTMGNAIGNLKSLNTYVLD